MSSASTAGPLPHPSYSLEGGDLGGAHRAMNGTSNGADGALKGATNRVFPHIDDLKAVSPDINPQASIRKILQAGEVHAKQADTHLDFRRPELALQEYIKASIIAVEIIPRHKDYPELRSDRGDLHRCYNGLQKRISAQHQKFEDVKEIIKTNNEQSGIKPKSQNGPVTVPVSGQTPHGTIQSKSGASLLSTNHDNPIRSKYASTTSDTSSYHNEDLASQQVSARNSDVQNHRQRPPVQPKPDILHGKAISTSLTRPVRPVSSGIDGDLAARFARLRTTETHSSGITQDPRIRTQPIGMTDMVNGNNDAMSAPASKTVAPRLSTYQQRPDRPSGPRDMPQVPSGPPKPKKISIDVDIPSMPRPPDAIYTPARNFDNPANMDMPRTTPRSMFSPSARPNTSSTMSSGLDGNAVSGTRQDYFSQISPVSNEAISQPTFRKTLPTSTTVTAEELMEFLKVGSHELRILLVDIRDREDFDNGHIMCQSILCIDPIVLRPGISADDLAQSLVLSPEVEQRLFDEREKFDLVIYYDENSLDNSYNMDKSGRETALADFSKAVFDFGYEKKLKQRPMLLTGGISSWIDLLGPGALRTSNTATATSGLSRKPLGKAPLKRGGAAARRRIYESRLLSKEEEAKWEQTLKNESLYEQEAHRHFEALQDGAPDDATFVRTTEDFFRRFPEPSAIRESMVTPSPVDVRSSHIAAARQDEFNSMTPKIPARPPPALPRQSYSGVSNRDPVAVTTVYKPTSIADGHGIPSRVDSISRPVGIRNHCGLTNFGATCYMNSVLQCLSSTSPVAQWLQTYDFSSPKPPRKQNEVTDPPQLMARNVANLMRHLWSQKFTFVTPQTLKDYIHAVARATGGTVEGMGGNQQQDANEFLLFLLGVVEDETNMRRNIPELGIRSAALEAAMQRMPTIQASLEEWEAHSRTTNSRISNLFVSQQATITKCGNCGYRSTKFNIYKNVFAEIGFTGEDDEVPPKRQDLVDCMRRTFSPSPVPDYKCDSCKQTNDKTAQLSRISYCPQILVLTLRRYWYNKRRGTTHKKKTIVNFEEELDLEPYFIETTDVGKKTLTEGTTSPFKYRCYAVVQHKGDTLNSGHYWALARDTNPISRRDSAEWFEFNDRDVRPASWEKTQNSTSYILFYQRLPPN